MTRSHATGPRPGRHRAPAPAPGPRSRALRRPWALLLAFLLVCAGAVSVLTLTPAAHAASTLAPGFEESVALSGLTNPTAVRFAPDGRVFVAEKSGVIKVFDSLADPTPDVFADLNVNVYSYWDRGLLGLALDPAFPTRPYVYVMYTYDHQLGSTSPAPRWGTPGVYSDPCPSPPGPTDDGCVVSSRISRLTASGNTMSGPEQVLVEDWCQQYPSHSVGSLEFGRDGDLYASAGEGANFNNPDYGQAGSPANPCADPPGSAGTALSAPTAQGGALRAQDLRTAGDPVTLDGTVIRINPDTGAGVAGNPLAGSADPNARRIISYGLRNPFRMTQRPGTGQVWVGDVGWDDSEEIDVIPSAGTMKNFGWPCYEGPGRQAGYDALNLTLCEHLYASPTAVTAPFFSYHHWESVVPGEACPIGSASIAGLQFAPGAGGHSWPAAYDGALFFADYSRGCIWVMPTGTNGNPDPARVRTFASGAATPVNLQIGPGGDLYYVDFAGGTIRRISYTSGNRTPVAVATASPTSGNAPLTVAFDGTGSSDPDPGDVLTYAWDLNGDGVFDDSTSRRPTFTYTNVGTYTASLRVSDGAGASATDTVTITVGNTPPTPVISRPAPGTTWKVGDVISFAGSATDQQDGTLRASRLSWELQLRHCPSTCHTHPIQTFAGVARGSFTAPDHSYPSYLRLRLTATDSGGLSSTRTLRLDPRTVALRFRTRPYGLALVVGSDRHRAPFRRTVIVGSANSVSAISPQRLAGRRYRFRWWSDGGAQTHVVTAPATSRRYTARFR